MIPIQGHKNLYRDEITGAVINKDDHAYAQYMKMKSKKDRQKHISNNPTISNHRIIELRKIRYHSRLNSKSGFIDLS